MEKVASQLFELVDQIANSTTLGEVWLRYLAASTQVGLEHGVACFLPNHRTRDFTVVTHALPSGWLEEYTVLNLKDGDLLAERLRTTDENFSWSMTDWDDAQLSAVERKWRD